MPKFYVELKREIEITAPSKDEAIDFLVNIHHYSREDIDNVESEEERYGEAEDDLDGWKEFFKTDKR